MPRIKKRTKSIASPAPSSQPDLSYETQFIVTILLLLFVYPIGLVCMWWWMKQWPMWLKFVITLPLVLCVFAFFAGIALLGSILHHIELQQNFQDRIRQQMQQEMMLTTTPIPTLPATTTPTTNTSGTY